MLLEVLPAELSSIREPEELATEHLHYRQFFVVWESLARVVECQVLETPSMTRDTRAAWLEDYKVRLPMSALGVDCRVFVAAAVAGTGTSHEALDE